MPKRHGELGEVAEAWYAAGCWSAYGVTSIVQPRPLTVVGDKTFYLQRPQVWVIQELYTDADADEEMTWQGRC